MAGMNLPSVDAALCMHVLFYLRVPVNRADLLAAYTDLN